MLRLGRRAQSIPPCEIVLCTCCRVVSQQPLKRRWTRLVWLEGDLYGFRLYRGEFNRPVLTVSIVVHDDCQDNTTNTTEDLSCTEAFDAWCQSDPASVAWRRWVIFVECRLDISTSTPCASAGTMFIFHIFPLCHSHVGRNAGQKMLSESGDLRRLSFHCGTAQSLNAIEVKNDERQNENW